MTSNSNHPSAQVGLRRGAAPEEGDGPADREGPRRRRLQPHDAARQELLGREGLPRAGI